MRKFLVLLVIFFQGNLSFSQSVIQHVEPPNWWAGMKHSSLQLMIHGENISEYSVKLKYPGVRIENVSRTDNPNYQFLNLIIEPSALSGDIPITFKKKGKKKIKYNYPLLDRVANSADRVGFNTKDVLYLITPDRFVNGDPTNDVQPGMREGINRKIPGGRHGGDIKGISDALPYIKDMGFTAVWLNPLLENDMEEYSYHGYSTTDYYKVDPRYGTNESYKALGKKAKEMGIGMIMDMIVNHCGSFHWWMDDLPAKNWINQWPEYQGTNHRKTLTQDPYASNIDKKNFTDGWFVPTMPDLNQRNPLMANYLTQNSIWWIEYADLSGIRMDTYPYPEASYMTEWTNRVMKEYPNFNVVGEEWSDSPAVLSYWQKGKKNKDGYTSELRSLMDFPLQIAVEQGLTAEESFGDGWIDIFETLGHDFLYADPSELVVFPDNHDMNRFYTQVKGDFDLFKLGMMFYATTRGVPQIYYGTEILMNNDTAPGDHGVIRSDFPGGWEGDKVDGFKKIGLTEDQLDAQKFTKELLNWRKGASAIHNGSLKHFVPEDGVYVYFRNNAEQKIMVILNKNKKSTQFFWERYAEELSGYNQAFDVLLNRVVPMRAPMDLKPMTGMILEIRR